MVSKLNSVSKLIVYLIYPSLNTANGIRNYAVNHEVIVYKVSGVEMIYACSYHIIASISFVNSISYIHKHPN